MSATFPWAVFTPTVHFHILARVVKADLRKSAQKCANYKREGRNSRKVAQTRRSGMLTLFWSHFVPVGTMLRFSSSDLSPTMLHISPVIINNWAFRPVMGYLFPPVQNIVPQYISLWERKVEHSSQWKAVKQHRVVYRMCMCVDLGKPFTQRNCDIFCLLYTFWNTYILDKPQKLQVCLNWNVSLYWLHLKHN